MFELGTYRGQLKDAVTTEAKTGSLQLALTFGVTERWNGTGWEGVAAPADRKLFISLTDKAWPYSSAKLEALNFNGDFESPAFETDPAGVELVCTEETYEGKPRERWALGSWGRELEQAAADKLKRLNARWRATVGGSKTPKATTAAPITPKPPPPSAPSEPARTSSRDKAWEILCHMWTGTEEELQAKWYEIIGEQAKPEDQFNPEDWGRVEAACEVPF